MARSRELALERQRRYRERHREELRAKGREYGRKRYREDRERELAKVKAWQAAHPEQTRDSRRRSYRKHRDKRLAEAKAYREAHVERVREGLRRWYQANADSQRAKAIVRDANRRAEIFGCDGEFTPQEREALLNAYEHRCAYCGGQAECIDHMVPLSRGGANLIENIVPACTSCNARKGTKTADEFLAGVAEEREKVEV